MMLVMTGPPMLSVGSGSTVPTGGVMFELLTKVPDDGAVPVMVYVTVLIAGRFAIVVEIALPLPFAVPQLAPPVGLPQVHVTLVSTNGTLSVKTASVTPAGPEFPTITE
jgi:hypothetical protein